MNAPSRDDYINALRAWRDQALTTYDADSESWFDSASERQFWGFNPPDHPISVAQVEALLSVEDDDADLALSAATRLSTYGAFRDRYPIEKLGQRAEYENGVPRCPSFFVLPRFCETYLDVRERSCLSDEMHAAIQDIIAESAEGIFYFAEWGPHNRTTLRAWALAAAARSVPDHPRVHDWQQLARQLAEDSLGRWSVEDAMLYHAVWTRSLLAYCDTVGLRRVLHEVTSRHYFDYYLNLLAPFGGLADFGDSDWASLSHLFIPCFERAAREFRDPHFRWAASELYARRAAEAKPVVPESLIHAIRWMDDTIDAAEPDWQSREVMDELVGRKIVFRSGWNEKDTFCLLNYKSESADGSTIRDYMKHTISVHSEKAHHGHGDENAICALTHNGVLLLHDAGYREGLSNDNGAYRADFYHNRVVVRDTLLREGNPVFPFLENNGQYRPTETCKVDFRSFQEVDFSRTRVIDHRAGWSHDRTIAWVKRLNAFAIIDAVTFLQEGHFTLSSLYFTHEILSQGEGWFDTRIGEMRSYERAHDDTSLLVVYPCQDWHWEGHEPVRRYYTDEVLLHQSTSGLGQPGRTRVLYSVLFPKDASADPASLAASVSIAPVSRPGKAAALQLATGDQTITVGTKLDLQDAILWEDVRPRRTWESGRTLYGDLETDAHFVYGRQNAGRLSYAWTEATRLDVRGTTCFQAPRTSLPLQYAGPESQDGIVTWRAWEQADVALDS